MADKQEDEITKISSIAGPSVHLEDSKGINEMLLSVVTRSGGLSYLEHKHAALRFIT